MYNKLYMSKKRVLILSSRTGGGHLAVANSLNQFLTERGHETKIYDLVNESSQLMDSIIVDSYLFQVANTPKLYKFLYYTFDNKIINRVVLSNFLISLCKKDLIRVCEEFEPDVVITTHPFHVPVVSKVKADFDYKIISIVTDFRHHNGYLSEEVDAYIVGSEYSKNQLAKEGIDKDIIFAYGIPVRKDFLKNSKKPAKKNKLHVLISGGSMGIPGIKTAMKQLVTSEDLQVSVVCASNTKLKKKLEKLAAGNPSATIYGYVDNMSELMDTADVIVAKPGGLTASESIIKNLPMIIPYYIPGQEAENKDFLVKNNMAIYVRDKRRIREAVESLITDQDKLKQMADNMKKVAENYSIDKIIELIEE